MKIELTSLDSEPLLYFLLHSGTFVLGLGAAFFLLGIAMGAAIWGRYKRQLRNARAENIGHLEEIAMLKRRLAEQNVRPPSQPLTTPGLLTEVLPDVGDLMLDRPAVEERREPGRPLNGNGSTPHLLKPRQMPLFSPPSAAPARSAPPLTAVAPKGEPEVPEVAPFDFLLGGPDPAPPPADATAPADLFAPETLSSLAAIVKAQAAPPQASALLPDLPDIDSPSEDRPGSGPLLPKPDYDPELGLVFKQAPEASDDLTQIKGVSLQIARQLQEFGIHTFAQIASWEERQVREVSNRLAFKDRIQRERWVEQARSLNEAKPEAND
jgi:predicted flap endonuclease-1-like 5' DNA nuclease